MTRVSLVLDEIMQGSVASHSDCGAFCGGVRDEEVASMACTPALVVKHGLGSNVGLGVSPATCAPVGRQWGHTSLQ